MEACWAKLSDLLTSADTAAAARAQSWLLQLLIDAAQRQQQDSPGKRVSSCPLCQHDQWQCRRIFGPS